MSKSKSPSLKPGQRAPESGQYGIIGPRGGNTSARSQLAYATPSASARYRSTSEDRRPLAARVPRGDHFDDIVEDETGPRADHLGEMAC